MTISQELSMNHASTSLTFPQQTLLSLEGWFVEILSTNLLAQSYPLSNTVSKIFTIVCFSASKLKFVTFTASFITFILSTTGSISIHTTSHFAPSSLFDQAVLVLLHHNGPAPAVLRVVNYTGACISIIVITVLYRALKFRTVKHSLWAIKYSSHWKLCVMENNLVWCHPCKVLYSAITDFGLRILFSTATSVLRISLFFFISLRHYIHS